MPGRLRPSSPAPAAEQLRRGGELGSRANQSGVVRCRPRGAINEDSTFTIRHLHNKASITGPCPGLPPSMLALHVCGVRRGGSGSNQRQGCPLRQSAGDKCCHVKRLDGAPSTTTKRPKPVSSQTAADWRGGLQQSEMRWTDTQHEQRANNAGARPPWLPACRRGC